MGADHTIDAVADWEVPRGIQMAAGHYILEATEADDAECPVCGETYKSFRPGITYEDAASYLRDHGGGVGQGWDVNLKAHHGDALNEAAAVVAERFSPQVLLGCIGEGIIAQEREIEGQPAVTVWVGRLPGVRLTPFHIQFHETTEGVGISGWPEQLHSDESAPVFLVLGDPYSTPGAAFLTFLEDRCPGAVASASPPSILLNRHPPSANMQTVVRALALCVMRICSTAVV